ncbi:MAG: 50S ribosomal protein L32e [Candidatus Aenigmarchaeota archaeon]|nr:50S ribosomal protein L32e [Candidatus Aenigmarchaeota archaeon]
MNLLKARKAKKRRKPPFTRQNAKNCYKVGFMWRKPRGRKSKLRRHKKNRGYWPHPGYGSPAETRYLHPSGLQEIMVSNANELAKIDSNKQAARISSTVGKKKRIEIQKKAEEMKIRILNVKKFEEK